MALPAPSYPHVDLRHDRVRQDGVPYITGTTMKVVELVAAQRAHGWSPEELHFQFPHLSMAQIHAALAFYWDHRQSLDEDLERRLDHADAERERWSASPLAGHLRTVKLDG